MQRIVGGKPTLSIARIAQMNFGFFGLQFSFGLLQGNIAPIYSYLGAKEAELPILLLAGPVTGLVVQPIVGALSDRTISRWGRRTIYIVAGAFLSAFGLFFMPLSNSIIMAVALLWILDTGNNMTMEPYRAYVSDRLNKDQHQAGFLSQAAFTGLAHMTAFLTPSILVLLGMNKDWVDDHNIPYTVRTVFILGAVFAVGTILFSIWRVPELTLTEAQKRHIEAQPKGVWATFAEIGNAIVDMPVALRKMALMSLFQWSAMASYWLYVIYSIALTVYNTDEANSDGFRSAVLTNGEMAAFFNGVAFLAAFAMVPIAKKIGAGVVHAICLVLGGIGMICIPQVTEKAMLFIPAIGVGLAWGSMMGNPYVILARAIPEERTGVYMGVFNMMIVTPMIILAVTVPFFYESLLAGDPRNVLVMAGVSMIIAAAAVLWIEEGRPQRNVSPPTE